MKITVPGELIQNIVLVALFPIAAAELKAKTDFESEALQQAPDGTKRPLFRYAVKVLRLDESGVAFAEEQNVNITVIEKIDIEAGVHYVPSGLTWITHYVDQKTHRQSMSLTATSLKRADQANKIDVADLASKLGAVPAPKHNNN